MAFLLTVVGHTSSLVGIIIYLDETGDHSMDSIDKDYPVFGLIFFIVDKAAYVEQIVPAVAKLKLDYFDHDGVILHSSDIRRQRGDFAILRSAATREAFMADVDTMMTKLPYTIIAVCIRKAFHKDRYRVLSRNPYVLALQYGMERVKCYLGELDQTEVVMVAESRGRNEDDSLRAAFFELMQRGTAYHSFHHLKISLTFVRKERNLPGLQLADLVAYPIGRHAATMKMSPPMKIIFPKILNRPGWRHGLKIFP